MSFIDILQQTVGKNKVLFKNFSSLTILQISQYIFPLITFPYLTRVLGPETFGLVHFAYLFTSYFNSFVDFGFNISATQNIARNKTDVHKISQIFWDVIFSKVFLLIISTAIFALLLISFKIFSENKALFILAYFSTIGTILFPHWLFMGKENMKMILLLNLPFKVLYLSSIFIFIRSEADWKLLVFLNSMVVTLIGFAGFFYAIKKYKIIYNTFVLKRVIKIIIESSQIFISLFSISLYSANNIFLLGLYSDPKTFGLFMVAEKLRLFMQIVPHNITESFFPKICRTFTISWHEGFSSIKFYSIFILFVAFTISLIGFIFSDLIIITIVGEEFKAATKYFKVLTWVPLIVAARETIGRQIMLNIGLKKEFMKIYILALILSLILSMIFVPLFYGSATSFILLVTELLVLLTMYVVVKKYLNNHAIH